MSNYLLLNNEVLNTYEKTGQIDRDKDKLATKEYFLNEINPNTVFFHDLKEKLDYMVEENYYEDGFLTLYPFSFVKKIFKIAYGYKFRFPSFMSASKFYNGYALKTRDGKRYLERYEDRVAIVSLYLAKGNKVLAEKSVRTIMESYQPATPTVLSAGKKARGEMVSCYKLLVDDDMNNIAHNIGNALQLSRAGGGVGLSLTDVRPLGDPIKKILNRSSGVMPVAKLLENSFSYANQLGARQGSGVIYLNIFHADIESFISAKKPNADDKIRLATLSTGVIIPDIFFDLLKQDKDIVLFSPYDIKNEYGISMSDMNLTEMYYELLDNPNIRNIKKINARKLYTEIKKTQFESGYPFEVFDDNVNEVHALKNLGRVKMSNLCTEILQYQQHSVINDYYTPDDIGLDVSCNLGSLDVHNSTKGNFEETVDTAMRLLTNVSDMTDNKSVPSVSKANKIMHSVGLGVMNANGHLAESDIEYGSDDSIQFIDLYMESLNYFSLKSSNEIAMETGTTFHGYKGSTYDTGEYFSQYVNKEEIEVSDVVKKALGNVPIITAEMWKELKQSVMKFGIYHSYRLAIAPTGSISYIRNSTASLAPITERVEIRDYGDSRTIYPAPFLKESNKHLFIEAYELDMFRMIDFYAAAQKHVDQGISMTLYVTDQWTTEQLTRLYYYAWMMGIKTVYYVRQRMQTLEECVSCSI